MQQSILTINAGSSSVKFALFELAEHISEKAAISGQIDGIGTAHVRLVAKDNTGTRIVDQALPAGADHATSFDQLLHWFSSSAKGGKIVAVGHRVVHGGDRYSHPVVLSPADLDQLANYKRLAPLHQPHNLNGIYAIEKVLAGVPQVACFDTAFHRTQSEIAQMYGLPRQYTEEGAKRYGFHGISYEYIASVLPQYCKKADGRVIVCHLGNGASMTAMVNRKCVATTLGFSTLDGLIMGTRCGPIDPGLILLAPSASQLAYAGLDKGLPVVEEIFADRAYLDDGNLVPRSQPGAMIHGAEASLAHVMRMVEEQALVSINGKRIPVKPQSICVHGDNAEAVATAQALLAQPPAALATMPYTLQAMQDATLALYQELADDHHHPPR